LYYLIGGDQIEDKDEQANNKVVKELKLEGRKWTSGGRKNKKKLNLMTENWFCGMQNLAGTIALSTLAKMLGEHVPPGFAPMIHDSGGLRVFALFTMHKQTNNTSVII